MTKTRIGIAYLIVVAALAGAALSHGLTTGNHRDMWAQLGILALLHSGVWACTYQYEIGEALRFARLGWKITSVPYNEKGRFVLEQARLPMPGSW